MEERAYRMRERAYIWTVGIFGLFLLAINLPQPRDLRPFLELAFMTLLVAIGESSPVTMPGGAGTVSVSLPVAYTVGVLYGLRAGIWVAALGTLRKKDLQGKVPLRIVLFNRAMISISMYLFCRTFSTIGGKFGSLEFPSGVLAFVVSACVYTLVNAVLITVAISLQSRMSFLATWRINITWGLPSLMAVIPVAIVMILAARQGGPWFLILFYVPLMVSKYSLERYVELRSAYREMATALSNAIDARDSYTRGHSERVADFAAMLAKQMKLPEDRVELIRYVGLLHDVGKVGIRDAIMKKPGTYTLEEYEEMKNHAKIGADMLEGMKFLGRGQDWVRYHHERWDGKGFPSGLSGDEIPLEARILACADSFDAMTTDRPYKSKMDFKAAREELIRCSGTQFDPEVVEAMLRVVDALESGKK